MATPKAANQWMFLMLFLAPMLLLSGCSHTDLHTNDLHASDKKPKDCPALEEDENGMQKIDQTGKKHWYCGKVPNGMGGYVCSPATAGKRGCNSCPNCSCQNVGSGATQNCVCQ